MVWLTGVQVRLLGWRAEILHRSLTSFFRLPTLFFGVGVATSAGREACEAGSVVQKPTYSSGTHESSDKLPPLPMRRT